MPFGFRGNFASGSEETLTQRNAEAEEKAKKLLKRHAEMKALVALLRNESDKDKQKNVFGGIQSEDQDVRRLSLFSRTR